MGIDRKIFGEQAMKIVGISEKKYHFVLNDAISNGHYIHTINYEDACNFFERVKKDYEKASFHTVAESIKRYFEEDGKDCYQIISEESYYICLDEIGRNNYAMKIICRIMKCEDEVEYYRSLLSEVSEQHKKLDK